MLAMLIFHPGVHFLKKANVRVDISDFLCDISDGVFLDEGSDFWVFEVDDFLDLMVGVGLEYDCLELEP